MYVDHQALIQTSLHIVFLLINLTGFVAEGAIDQGVRRTYIIYRLDNSV